MASSKTKGTVRSKYIMMLGTQKGEWDIFGKIFDRIKKIQRQWNEMLPELRSELPTQIVQTIRPTDHFETWNGR